MINNNKGIFFIDDLEGWLFGTDGSIFHTTTNGGAEWSRQESRIPLINGHVRETVNGIHFFDKQHGVAVADIGFIVNTMDGGNNWQLCESVTDNNMTVVQFTNRNEAWAVGWHGTILKSNDSGQTWEMVNGRTSNDLEQVAFADGNRGLAVGQHGTITMTQDGGELGQKSNRISGIISEVSTLLLIRKVGQWVTGV